VQHTGTKGRVQIFQGLIFAVAMLCRTLLLVLLLLPAGCAGQTKVRHELQVEDLRYQLLPGGARIVSGKLINPTTAPVSSAQIQVSLFDGDNRWVGDLHILVQNIGPGMGKPFREPVDSDADVRGARVRSILVL